MSLFQTVLGGDKTCEFDVVLIQKPIIKTHKIELISY